MFRTIRLSSHIFVQGLLRRTFPDGRIEITVGQTSVVGFPVTATNT